MNVGCACMCGSDRVRAHVRVSMHVCATVFVCMCVPRRHCICIHTCLCAGGRGCVRTRMYMLYQFKFQVDGNLVLYHGNSAKWNSGRATSNRLKLQTGTK